LVFNPSMANKIGVIDIAVVAVIRGRHDIDAHHAVCSHLSHNSRVLTRLIGRPALKGEADGSTVAILAQDFKIDLKSMPIMPSAHISAKAATPRSRDVAQVTVPALWDPTIVATAAPSRVVLLPFPLHLLLFIDTEIQGPHQCADSSTQSITSLPPFAVLLIWVWKYE